MTKCGYPVTILKRIVSGSPQYEPHFRMLRIIRMHPDKSSTWLYGVGEAGKTQFHLRNLVRCSVNYTRPNFCKFLRIFPTPKLGIPLSTLILSGTRGTLVPGVKTPLGNKGGQNRGTFPLRNLERCSSNYASQVSANSYAFPRIGGGPNSGRSPSLRIQRRGEP